MDRLLCGPTAKAAPGEAFKQDHTPVDFGDPNTVGEEGCILNAVKKLCFDLFRLTAYVAKVFAMANSLVAVPNNMICEAVKFLILRAQQPDGVFTEVGKVAHGEMIV